MPKLTTSQQARDNFEVPELISFITDMDSQEKITLI